MAKVSPAGFVAGVCCVAQVLLGVSLAHAKPDALSLMRESDARHNRVRVERTRATLTLIARDGEQRVRSVEMLAAQEPAKGDKLRVRFLSPADIKGTALLSLENPGAEDEQWLYLPAFRRTRRVGAGELGDRFAGTDFLYEDLKRRRVEDYRYTLLRQEKLGGHDCYVIESVPSAPKVVKESPYGKSVVWLRRDVLHPVRVRIFDRNGKPLKEFSLEGLRAVAGKVWRPDATTIVDVQRQHRTVLRVERRELDVPLPPGAFTKASLAE